MMKPMIHLIQINRHLVKQKKNDTDLPSPIYEVPIVAIKATFFQVIKYLLVYHKILYQGNHHQCQLTTPLLALRFILDILTRLS